MLAFLGLGPLEIAIVGVVAVLLFGSRLPAVARSAGKSLTEFKRGMQDLQDDVRRSIDADEFAQSGPKRLEGSVTDGAVAHEPYSGYPEPEPPPYRDDAAGDHAADDHAAGDQAAGDQAAGDQAADDAAADSDAAPAETAETSAPADDAAKPRA